MINKYKKSGVNYDYLDPVKKLAQSQGLETKNNFKNKFSEVSESRGESAYVFEAKDCYYATTIEGLGTKNLVADEFSQVTKKTYYDILAQDTVAMIINDVITVGARPLTVSAYWATGDSRWWKNKKRAWDLIKGWKNSCDQSGTVWGGGETPALSNVIEPSAIDLAGSTIGIIKPKKRLVTGKKVKPGDVIVFLESNGIHANGLSLIRNLAKKVKGGYKAKCSNGKMFGEEILKPTVIYANVINDLLDTGVDIHYMINITGHGWRKLMRLNQDFSYIIDKVPKVSPLFAFIKEKGKLSDKEMYATFNMGAGFALIVSDKHAATIFNVARKNNMRAWVGGYVQKGKRRVKIKPMNIEYSDKELNIR